jgi:hypothetical protein
MRRLHDLWILLAWAGIITTILLNTFYNRGGCYEFTSGVDQTAPCQSLLVWGFFFLAAVGAGAVINDERLGILGFIFVHAGATALFLLALLAPFFFGVTDPSLFNTVLTQSLVIAVKSQFPFVLFFSFAGALLGLFFGSKLGD